MTTPRPPTDAEIEQLIAEGGSPVRLTAGPATSLVGWLYDPDDLPEMLSAVADAMDATAEEDP